MTIAERISRWPTPFEAERGAEVAADYGVTGPVRDLIAGVAGCSPYLHDILRRERAWIEASLEAPEDALAALMAPDSPPGTLRRDKRRMAGLLALLDLGGIWTLEQVTGALSGVADRAVDAALASETAALVARGKLPADHGLTVIGMGKLGAGELNYSSDIDLICLMYDAELTFEEASERRAMLIRAVRAAMKRLSEVTAEGYVFRTDLRLRPDAAVTPVVLATSVAESYYESQGRTWERAAYIKARACAGDIAAGERFLEALTPFIWRRHLDFAAIEDAHSILLKIREHKGLSGPITLPGHDMKLGRGGIREIEFFAQTRQLISGGRDAELRHRGTRPALSALGQAGWVAPDTCGVLDAAYVRHREVEHRLQMLRDAQTHSLPHSEEGFARLAAFMGREQAELEAALTDDLEAVHALTEPFFAPAETGPAPMEFGADTTARWLNYPALRSGRAARVFERVKPRLLERLAAAADPDRALAQFDSFISGLPAGVQVFSLFEANPQLIDLLADIAAVAPALAEYLGRNAAVLDAVLGGEFFAPWPGCVALGDDLEARLGRESDYEAELDAARAWAKEWHFRIGVHHLRGLTDGAEAGAQYADLAEAVLRGLWPRVVAEFARKHGAPPGQGAAVVAMGSLGAGRLHSASDLDLILIYDAEGVEASDGPRPLATRPYFSRLTQALITALTAPMSQGRLYEVDMRLRPSGRNGPVATSVDAFENYQREEAWTWEHLALTRARPVAGGDALCKRIEAFREGLLAAPKDAAKIASDVEDMRARILAARPGEGGFAAKDGRGRLQDLELFAQTLALLAGSAERVVTAQLRSGDLPERGALCDHDRLLWQVRAATRLILKPNAPVESLAAGARDFLLRETGAENLDALENALQSGSEAAAAIMDRHLAALGAAPK
ncbi:MAG: glutamine-synthetase adenylyltransferase [Pseudomonadota bacterium]